MTTYSELDALLHSSATKKPVPSRKIGNNTYAQRRDHGAIAVRLHDTDILTYTPKRYSHPREPVLKMTDVECAVEIGYDVEINTGGWLTITTKNRINAHLPHYRIDSLDGRWFLNDREFQDGLLWYRDGCKVHVRPGRTMSIVTGFMVDDERERADRHNRQMNKLIDRYLKGWNDTSHERVVNEYGPIAVNGCALCLKTSEGLIGERMGDVQHLIEHLMERVLPQTVWMAAIESCKYRNPMVVLQHRTMAMQALRKYLRGQLYVQHTASRRHHVAA